MVDRKPTYKNRVLITKESDGSQEYITWEHADEPITEGTPLNKQTLLSDDTATELGLSSEDEQTPNGAFAQIAEDLDSMADRTVTLPASDWSDSAPYTQTVTVSGMTADWKPGTPTLPKSDTTLNVSTCLAELEALRCINACTSSTNALTFMCFEDRPETTITIDVPGQLKKG